ncbi:hypothetical protein BaRGS_00037909 [Batillaria attramentaria]|uniref:Uncharacterized protein n=1 Tax=Batillaria attramentaria TaxID=370345 RepID=A0ABD0J7N2_9CAEN
MPCPQWPQGLGKHWLALGLLLVCVTTPGSALAFPNDVLSRLSELYHKDADRHHHAENSSSSLLSFPSMSSEERGPLLIKTVSSSPSSGDASYTSTDSHKGCIPYGQARERGRLWDA